MLDLLARRGWAVGLAAGLLALGTACPGPDPQADDDDDATPEPPPEPERHLFSFAVIADPHIAGPESHETRLQLAIDWINGSSEERRIELVVVLGDIGWGPGLARSEELLQGLDLPWVPIIGDNVLQAGDEAAFDTTFRPQYEQLSGVLEDWRHADTPVWHDATGDLAWLQNFSFRHRGRLFVGLDWNVRGQSGLLSEFGDLNDVEGGSWSWLVESMDAAQDQADESIILLSHVPMAPFSFTSAQQEQFAGLVAPRGREVYANLAGHLHVTYEEEFSELGYTTIVTEATWDDANEIRVIEVWGNDQTTTYQHERVLLAGG